MIRSVASVVVLLALMPGLGRACNVCLEDKIAATYDWQVVTNAERAHHTVVFVAIRGVAAARNPTLERSLQQTVGSVKGVDPGTVRVSLEPPAASFACDPARHSSRRLVAALNRALASRHLSVAIVRVGAPGTTLSTRLAD